VIAKEEARQFWGTNFAKVNAQAMFNEVDVDGNTLSRPGLCSFFFGCGGVGRRDRPLEGGGPTLPLWGRVVTGNGGTTAWARGCGVAVWGYRLSTGLGVGYYVHG